MTDKQLMALMAWVERRLSDNRNGYGLDEGWQTKDARLSMYDIFGFLEDGLGSPVAPENIDKLPEHLRPK